jgi:hypothetical protein
MGMKNINNNENITIILGCYKGLYLKEVPSDILYKCFVNNKLDELIHKKYTATKSGYYNQFVDKKIKIGNTYINYQYLFELDEDEIRDLKKKKIIPKNADDEYKIYIKNDNINILDDNHCPRCDEELPNNEIFHSYTCQSCIDMIKINNTNKKNENIVKKLQSHMKTDIQSFGRKGTIDYDNVVTLLNKQQFRCYICKDKVLITFEKYCLYQFSLDRIDNNLPHDKNNVLISCYFCNCRNFLEMDSKTRHSVNNLIYDKDTSYKLTDDYKCVKNKICINGCHTISRDIIIKKKDIDKTIINNLIL